jgi:CRP-like cAMP-binding protein
VVSTLRIKEEVELLADIPLFTDLKGDRLALEYLATLFEDRTYGSGEEILSEGKPGEEMYLLVQGQAVVMRHTLEGEEYRVAILNGGHGVFFGEGGLLDAEPRTATIRAETECQTLVLKVKKFEEMGRLHPEWAYPVMKRIARATMNRMRKANDDLMLLYKALVSEVRGE